MKGMTRMIDDIIDDAFLLEILESTVPICDTDNCMYRWCQHGGNCVL